MNNNPLLLILPIGLLILGIIEIIFAKRFASFYQKPVKFEWRPTVKPMPGSHYTPGLVRGIGVAIVVSAIFIGLIVFIG